MPESNIDLILHTKREGDATQEATAELAEMKTGLTDLEKAMSGTRTTIGGLDRDVNLLGSNLGSAADLVDGLGVALPITPMALFGEALQATGQFVKEAIGDYSDYVMEVDKIASYTGMASEETSKLIQVADDYRIETGQLEMALKTMTEQGTVPTIDGLAQLSDQYLAIQDPLAKAQFLTDNFGRSGMDMARIMELGGENLKTATDEVSKFMIVTGKSKEQAEEYVKALDNWNDSVDGLKYSIASGLVPSLTSLLNLLNGPSADNAANVINTIFSGTFLDHSGNSGSGRAGGGRFFRVRLTRSGEREVGIYDAWFSGHGHACKPRRFPDNQFHLCADDLYG